METNNTATTFFKKLASGGEVGRQGTDQANSFVRTKIRETSIIQQYLPAQPITVNECDYYVDSTTGEVNRLVKYVEVEPDSTGAPISFRGMPESKRVKGQAVPAFFGPIESEEYIANIYEIGRYRNDIKKILNDQSVKNIATQYDLKWFAEMNRIVVAAGDSQNYVVPGNFTRENWINALQQFPIKKPIGCVIMNTKTSKEIMKWNYWKDIPPEDAKNISTGNIIVPGQAAGVKAIYTTDDDKIANGVVWILPAPDFFGKAFVMQEPTLFFKQEKNNVIFSTQAVYGGVIAATDSFIKVTFTYGS